MTRECPDCVGVGVVYDRTPVRVNDPLAGYHRYSFPCTACGGTGTVDTCESCGSSFDPWDEALADGICYICETTGVV